MSTATLSGVPGFMGDMGKRVLLVVVGMLLAWPEASAAAKPRQVEPESASAIATNPRT